MRTDNRSVKNVVVFIYFLLIVFTFLLVTVFKSLNIYTDSTLIILACVFVLVVVFYSIAGYFEYDSDGGKIVILNRGLILTEYVNYREHKIEFTKQQLASFKIKNYLVYKSLIVLIKSNNGQRTKNRFNVTLLKRKKLKYVKQSLNKMIKENRNQLG